MLLALRIVLVIVQEPGKHVLQRCVSDAPNVARGLEKRALELRRDRVPVEDHGGAEAAQDGFLFDVEIFIRSRALGIPVIEVPVQLTYEDDVTTVQQFRQLFTVIPELIHIKVLELRGAYGARGVAHPRFEEQFSEKDKTAAPVGGSRPR